MISNNILERLFGKEIDGCFTVQEKDRGEGWDIGEKTLVLHFPKFRKWNIEVGEIYNVYFWDSDMEKFYKVLDVTPIGVLLEELDYNDIPGPLVLED